MVSTDLEYIWLTPHVPRTRSSRRQYQTLTVDSSNTRLTVLCYLTTAPIPPNRDTETGTAQMPYTAPVVYAPAASRLHISSVGRSQVCSDSRLQGHASSHGESQSTGACQQTSSRAYLSRHRRSPSISSSPPRTSGTEANPSRPPGQDAPSLERAPQSDHPFTTATDDAPTTSSRASSSNSSEDEAPANRGTGRTLENLAELQEAIRSMEQKRSSSPTGQEEARRTRVALGLESACGKPTEKAESVKATLPKRPALSAEARKISHSRSNTETSAIRDFPVKEQRAAGSGTRTDFEDADDIEIGNKPPLLRKKSGEPIRPALRPSSAGRRRPSSMPGTPTYGKAVHFDHHLEHVRTFLQVDRPLAVSAGSSPVENYESDSEFPFTNPSRAPQFEWDIRLPNFPTSPPRPEKAAAPVKMERLSLSTDNTSLLGSVAVQNLAFHKLVAARFTFDFWQTTSEVKADFSTDVRRRQLRDGYDRFDFKVKITDQAHLDKKQMFLCIRYNVNGQDYWDNNGSMNYQVDFSKKPRPHMGKNGFQGAAARPLQDVPRSKQSPSAAARPRSFPSVPDDFATGLEDSFEFSSFPQPSARRSEHPPLKSRKPETDLVPNLPARRSNATGQAFGNRYDFGASLSAAMQAASSTLGDRSGLPPQPTSPNARPQPSSGVRGARIGSSAIPDSLSDEQPDERKGRDDHGGIESSAASKDGPSAPYALTAEKPPLQSSSYHELLNKYCFVRSGPTKASSLQC